MFSRIERPSGWSRQCPKRCRPPCPPNVAGSHAFPPGGSPLTSHNRYAVKLKLFPDRGNGSVASRVCLAANNVNSGVPECVR